MLSLSFFIGFVEFSLHNLFIAILGSFITSLYSWQDYVEVEEKASFAEVEVRGKEGGTTDGDIEPPYPLTDEEEEMEDGDLVKMWRQEAVLAKKIDKICRALFPFLFIIFNLIYWIHYQVIT